MSTSLWIIHEPMEKNMTSLLSVPHLLSKFSQGCEDFHFLLCVHIPWQFPHYDISVHLRRISHTGWTIFRPSNTKTLTLWGDWAVGLNIHSTTLCIQQTQTIISLLSQCKPLLVWFSAVLAVSWQKVGSPLGFWMLGWWQPGLPNEDKNIGKKFVTFDKSLFILDYFNWLVL